jgi:hypothetical protein
MQVAQVISFSGLGGHDKSYFELTCKRYKNFVSTDPITHEVEIKFSDIPDFLITIRNRFFHSRIGDGKENINTIEMPDSDEYFKRINSIIVGFLAIMTFQTIAAKYHV